MVILFGGISTIIRSARARYILGHEQIWQNGFWQILQLWKVPLAHYGESGCFCAVCKLDSAVSSALFVMSALLHEYRRFD